MYGFVNNDKRYTTFKLIEIAKEFGCMVIVKNPHLDKPKIICKGSEAEIIPFATYITGTTNVKRKYSNFQISGAINGKAGEGFIKLVQLCAYLNSKEQ